MSDYRVALLLYVEFDYSERLVDVKIYVCTLDVLTYNMYLLQYTVTVVAYDKVAADSRYKCIFIK